MATWTWIAGLLAASLFAFGAGATTLVDLVVLPPDAQAELPDVELPDVVLGGDGAGMGADASGHPSADDLTESGLPEWLQPEEPHGPPTWLGEEGEVPTWLILPESEDGENG